MDIIMFGIHVILILGKMKIFRRFLSGSMRNEEMKQFIGLISAEDIKT